MSKQAAEQARKAFDADLDAATQTILDRWRAMQKSGLLKVKQLLRKRQGQSSEK